MSDAEIEADILAECADIDVTAASRLSAESWRITKDARDYRVPQRVLDGVLPAQHRPGHPEFLLFSKRLSAASSPGERTRVMFTFPGEA